MLIPSIDLQDGQVVQLEQGSRLRWASSDLDAWISRFAGFPLVQVIDLDAARGRGHNGALVARLCAALPCQVGGGIRDVDRARALVERGARRLIIGSALFGPHGVDVIQAAAFAEATGEPRLVAAIDSRAGFVTVRGWQAVTRVTPAEAVRLLAPHVGAFLYTHVDTEGLLTGLDPAAVLPLRMLTTRAFIAAGGIRQPAEVEALDAAGIDAVVGMAIYTGAWTDDDLDRLRRLAVGRQPSRRST